MDFGVSLRELRERRAMTQFDLATQSGISQSTISALETGKQRPWPSTRKNLAAAFGMTLEEFDDETSPAPAGPPDTLESASGSEMLERLVKSIHRLEDQNSVLEQDLELLRRFIEDLPVVMWTTDITLRVTSFIGWADGRRTRWDEVVGRSVAEGFAMAFDPAQKVIEAHESALQGDSSAICVESIDRNCHLRIEPRRDTHGKIVGLVGVAMCQEENPGNSRIALAG